MNKRAYVVLTTIMIFGGAGCSFQEQRQADLTTSGTEASTSTSSGTVVPQIPPVSNLEAKAPTLTSVQLSWKDNTGGVASFYIQRRATHGTEPFATVAQVEAGSTTYLDSGLTYAWQYDYLVIPFIADQTATSSPKLTIQVLGNAAVAVGVNPTPSPMPAPSTSQPVTEMATN